MSLVMSLVVSTQQRNNVCLVPSSWSRPVISLLDSPTTDAPLISLLILCLNPYCVWTDRQVTIRRNHRKSQWKGQEDEKTQDNILESTTSAAQQEVSENTVFSTAWKSRTCGITWIDSNSGESDRQTLLLLSQFFIFSLHLYLPSPCLMTSPPVFSNSRILHVPATPLDYLFFSFFFFLWLEFCFVFEKKKMEHQVRRREKLFSETRLSLISCLLLSLVFLARDYTLSNGSGGENFLVSGPFLFIFFQNQRQDTHTTDFTDLLFTFPLSSKSLIHIWFFFFSLFLLFLSLFFSVSPSLSLSLFLTHSLSVLFLSPGQDLVSKS